MEDRTVSNETEVAINKFKCSLPSDTTERYNLLMNLFDKLEEDKNAQMIHEADDAIKAGKAKKPILSAFVEEGTFKTVKALASAEGRSVSYIVKQAVLEYLQRHSMSNVDTGRIIRKRQIQED
jgi:hypothetical protein